LVNGAFGAPALHVPGTGTMPLRAPLNLVAEHREEP